MNQPLKASSSQQSAMGGPLPVLLDFRNGGRGWRMSLGALVQATLLGLVLVLPLLVTESFTARPEPAEFRRPIRLGSLGGKVDGPKPSSEQPVKKRPDSHQVYLPVQPPPDTPTPNVAGIGDPTIGANGTGSPWLGRPDGDPSGGSPTGPFVPGDQLQPQPPAPPSGTVLKGGNVRRPKLIHRVEPDYPRLAKLAGIQGDVVLEALLDKDGRVRNVEVKSGPTMLADAAKDAVSQWVYEPTYLNGVPYPVLLQVTVEFRLKR